MTWIRRSAAAQHSRRKLPECGPQIVSSQRCSKIGHSLLYGWRSPYAVVDKCFASRVEAIKSLSGRRSSTIERNFCPSLLARFNGCPRSQRWCRRGCHWLGKGRRGSHWLWRCRLRRTSRRDTIGNERPSTGMPAVKALLGCLGRAQKVDWQRRLGVCRLDATNDGADDA